MSDTGVDDVFDDADFEQCTRGDNDNNTGKMSYDDLKRLALDCEVVIGRHERTIATLKQQIQTRVCHAPTAPLAPDPKGSDTSSQEVHELRRIVDELKKENALLSENETRLRDMLDIQRSKRREWKSKRVDALQKQLEKKTDEVVMHKMVITTLKKEIERLRASTRK